MTEEWRPVVGYEGLYEVSNKGRVRKIISGRILKDRDNGRGYRYVRLHHINIDTVYVHRLVAQAFIPNPLDLPQVNHKDEDKSNNSVDNLEWCTAKYNIHYGTAIDRISKKNGVKISQYSLDGTWIRDWNSSKEAIKSLGGSSLSSICNCLRGRSKSAFGYMWKYK